MNSEQIAALIRDTAENLSNLLMQVAQVIDDQAAEIKELKDRIEDASQEARFNDRGE